MEKHITITLTKAQLAIVQNAMTKASCHYGRLSNNETKYKADSLFWKRLSEQTLSLKAGIIEQGENQGYCRDDFHTTIDSI